MEKLELNLIIQEYKKYAPFTYNTEHLKYVNDWLEWYANTSENKFLKYDIMLSSGRKTTKYRKSLNMAKKICEDITKLVLSEQPTITLNDDFATERLKKILNSKENDFFNNLTVLFEKTLALGTGLITEYIENNKVKLEYITANSIIPFEYSNNYIKGLITISVENIEKDEKYYYITNHYFNDETYSKNITILKQEKNGKVINATNFERFKNLEKKQVYMTKNPHFQILKNRIANNKNNSPMGISIFANSINTLETMDVKFDSFNSEFILGRKKVAVDASALQNKVKFIDGNPYTVTYFDASNELYIAIDGMENQPIKELNMTLRTDEHINAINKDISIFCSQVGLGDNYYTFNNQGLKTATEIISNKSEAYKTKENLQNNLRTFITDVVKAVCEIEKIPCDVVNIQFNDAIIEDLESQKASARLDVMQGLMSKKRYMMDYLGLSEDEATRELQNIQDEKAEELGDFE